MDDPKTAKCGLGRDKGKSASRRLLKGHQTTCPLLKRLSVGKSTRKRKWKRTLAKRKATRGKRPLNSGKKMRLEGTVGGGKKKAREKCLPKGRNSLYGTKTAPNSKKKWPL